MTPSWLRHAREAARVTVGVLGDLILDRYLRGETERISPEAPIPVLAVRREETRLGGAGNVAQNLVALGVPVRVAGVVGDDDRGGHLVEMLERLGVDVSGVVVDATRPTVEKVRLVARSQQVLRFDREDRRPVEGGVEERLVAAVERLVRESDVVVVSDYAKGTLSPKVLATALSGGARVLVDPKGSDYSRYRGAWAITPNRAEAEAATGVAIGDDDDLDAAAERLLEIVASEAAVVTLGADGIYCRRRGGVGLHVRSEARRVFDVTGAGDTVIALLARFVGAGVPIEDAVRIANAGAGVVVAKLGAASVTPHELLTALRKGGVESSHKIVGWDEARALVLEVRAEGRTIVFTNGCFDLFHAGHARYLSWARAQGDFLVVGLNDDASVTRLKGEGRPVQPLADRAEVLASLEAVDLVVPFGEDTPQELIDLLEPDVLVKGDDWRGREVAGAESVRRRGGRVLFAPLLPGRSSSTLIERARGEGSAD